MREVIEGNNLARLLKKKLYSLQVRLLGDGVNMLLTSKLFQLMLLKTQSMSESVFLYSEYNRKLSKMNSVNSKSIT